MKFHGIAPALLCAALLSTGMVVSTSSLADSRPKTGVVNYETGQVHPVDMTPDRNTLLVVNTAANALEIFDLSSGTPKLRATIPVGLDPVTVRARSNTEAWVVNQISDSVSIIDLSTGRVTGTLKTENEPADVVFAAGKAYVTCSDANAVLVYTLSNLAAAPRKVAIIGEEPRALAVNANGTEVYVAIFESGNGTTALDGRATIDATGKQVPLIRNVVNRAEGPWKGQNPPPNSGTSFNPPLPAGTKPHPVGLIIRQDDTGRWMDDNKGDWTRLVSGDLSKLSNRVAGWKLPDNDVAIISTSNDAVIGYKSRLMNLNMAMDINPATGQITVVGTDAINQIRYEPNVNGKFVQMKLAMVMPGEQTANVKDLNPHLTYQTPSVPVAQRSLSLGDPRGIKWRADGQTAWVTGMGSDNVIIINNAGARITQISVGEGPTGLALDEGRGRAYVLNRFAGSVSVLDLNSRTELSRVAFYDPTPAVIKAGRPLLYSTKFSGTGHTACASCHVDAKTDRLAWDLGDPRGAFIPVKDIDINAGLPTGTPVSVHPMKGPMLTQTFQDIMNFKTLHWRGDKNSLAEFAPAYVNLMSGDAQPTAAQMKAFGDFLATVHLPPNPNRNMDDTRKTSITLPDLRTYTATSSTAFLELRGKGTGRVNCLNCHLQQGTAPRNSGSARLQGQSFVPPGFAPLYKRVGFWPNDVTGSSTSGFGFQHDGAEHVDLAVTANTGTTFQQAALSELLSLEGPTSGLVGGEKRMDTHAGVGTQLMASGVMTAAQTAQLDQMISIAANSPHASLIFRRVQNGVQKGGYLERGSLTSFQGNTLLERLTRTTLINDAAAGTPVTFTLVARGAEHRYGVDADADGILDGDEQAAGTNPRDPSTPVTVTSCASEGSSCGFSGTQVVRFGNPTVGYSMGVFTGKVACNTTSFNDPGIGGTRRCEVVRKR